MSSFQSHYGCQNKYLDDRLKRIKKKAERKNRMNKIEKKVSVYKRGTSERVMKKPMRRLKLRTPEKFNSEYHKLRRSVDFYNRNCKENMVLNEFKSEIRSVNKLKKVYEKNEKYKRQYSERMNFIRNKAKQVISPEMKDLVRLVNDAKKVSNKFQKVYEKMPIYRKIIDLKNHRIETKPKFSEQSLRMGVRRIYEKRVKRRKKNEKRYGKSAQRRKDIEKLKLELEELKKIFKGHDEII
jgi:hypothetical protein